MAIATFVTPSLTFPFRGGTLKYEELSATQKPLGMATCHSHNFHRNVARMILAGPALLGGLEEPLFAVKTNKENIHVVTEPLGVRGCNDKLLRISLGHAQLAIGSGTALFKLRYKEHEHLIPETWIKL